MSPVEGVPKINALGAVGLLGLAGLCSLLSLALPWWTGNSSIGQVVDVRSQRATATLWSFDLGVARPDPNDITQSIVVPVVVSWDEMCADKDMTAEEEPGNCKMIRAVRGFAVMTLLITAISAGVLVVGVNRNVLLLLPGALCAGFAGGFGILGVLLAMSMNTDGLTGIGCIALLGAGMLSFGGAAFGMYAAVNAMKDMEFEETRVPRQARAEEARNKDHQQAMQLEEGIQKSRTGSDSDTREKSKAHKVLKNVLFWGKDPRNEGSAIPTAMLEAAFREIDATGDGTIDSHEFCEALQVCGLPVTQTTVDIVMKEIDKNASGDIDIHEFVEFFRKIEELGDFGSKQAQQAQFLSLICNCCFLLHIVLFSVLLLSFINMPEGNSDSRLIFQNLLFGVAFVLVFLLVAVICLPAIRLTMGPSITSWQNAYEVERAKRMTKKKPASQNSGIGNLRGAAWSGSDHVNPVTTRVPVNAALHGASYRTSRMQPTYEDDVSGYDQEMTQRPGRSESHLDGIGDFGAGEAVDHQPAPVEQYDPNAYRYAAMLAIEARQSSSFSPMQVRDLDVAPDTQSRPGAPALTY